VRTAPQSAALSGRQGGRPNPEAFAPGKEIWLEEKLSWEAANPALPQYARFSTPAPPRDDGV
jgi:hypothetical protein